MFVFSLSIPIIYLKMEPHAYLPVLGILDLFGLSLVELVPLIAIQYLISFRYLPAATSHLLLQKKEKKKNIEKHMHFLKVARSIPDMLF